MKEMKFTLGQKFRLLRENAKKTQKETAELLKMQLSTYVKLEDDFLFPKESTLNKAAALYGLTYEGLLAVGE